MTGVIVINVDSVLGVSDIRFDGTELFSELLEEYKGEDCVRPKTDECGDVSLWEGRGKWRCSRMNGYSGLYSGI